MHRISLFSYEIIICLYISAVNCTNYIWLLSLTNKDFLSPKLRGTLYCRRRFGSPQASLTLRPAQLQVLVAHQDNEVDRSRLDRKNIVHCTVGSRRQGWPGCCRKECLSTGCPCNQSYLEISWPRYYKKRMSCVYENIYGRHTAHISSNRPLTKYHIEENTNGTFTMWHLPRHSG